MHALIHMKDEAHVAANEPTIETHIAFLRLTFDDIKVDIRELRAGQAALPERINALHERINSVEKALNQKIDDLARDIRKELNEKIDQLRTEVEARIGTLSTAINARFDKAEADVSARFDKVQAEVNARFDKVQAEVNARFEKVDAEIKVLNEKVSKLDEKVDKLAIGFAELKGLHATVLWVCGSFVAVVVAAVTIGEAIGWIGPPRGVHSQSEASELFAPDVPHAAVGFATR